MEKKWNMKWMHEKSGGEASQRLEIVSIMRFFFKIWKSTNKTLTCGDALRIEKQNPTLPMIYLSRSIFSRKTKFEKKTSKSFLLLLTHKYTLTWDNIHGKHKANSKIDTETMYYIISSQI